MSMQKTQASWWQDMEITSEKEYHQATDRLAAELRREHSPEQLAVLVAQHLIYAHEQQARLNELTAELQRARLECQVLRDGLVCDVTKLAKTVVDAYPKHVSRKANDGRHHHNRARRASALREWENWGERDSKGKKVAKDFAEKHCAKHGVTKEVMLRWIYGHEKKQKTQPVALSTESNVLSTESNLEPPLLLY